MRAAPLFLLLALPLIGCSRDAPPVASTAPAEPGPVAIAAPMPRPPFNAAQNLTLPAQFDDGSFATPNRNLSDAATIWHVRSALNVAVLTCGTDPALTADYNRLLSMQRAPLAKAYAALTTEYPPGDMDRAMTRVYNYFAQPPAQSGFCTVAAPLLAEAAVVAPQKFTSFAHNALPQLDAPFVAFFRAYAAYRADLAQWRTGQVAEAAPRIAYDSQQFLRDDAVTGGQSTQILATR